MYMKIAHEKQIHLLNKKVNIKELNTFIRETFKNIPRQYSLTYLDSDGDQISLVSQDDVKTLYQTSVDKFVKVLITPVSQNLSKQPATEIVVEEVQKKEEKVEEVQVIPEFISEDKNEEIKVQENITESQEQKKEQPCQNKEGWGFWKGWRRSPKNEQGTEKKCPWKFGDFPRGGFHGWNKPHGPFHGSFSGSQPEQNKEAFSHPHPHGFKGFPGFEFMKAKFDWAVTNKIEEMMPCIINKVKNALQKKEDTKQESKVERSVHHGVRCDGCSVFPILGTRYKCNECHDFDFCEKCVQTVEHNHDFLMIRNPKRRCHFGKGFNLQNKPHHSWGGFGGCHNKGFWGRPEHKIKKRQWKLSEIFGGEPADYKEFIESTLDLECEEMIKKYSTDKNIQPKEITEQKIERRSKKLSHMLGKPAESLRQIVKAHPYTKCWKLSKIVRDSQIMNIPESVSVVIESLPSTVVESKVEVVAEVPKEVSQPIEKKVECSVPKEQKSKSKSPKRCEGKKSRQQILIEDITKLVKQVIGDNESLVEFVKTNWKLGADKIIEMWFEQH